MEKPTVRLHQEAGFTLLEMMIALTLGLMISAAAIQVFLTSQREVSVQQGTMDLQNASLFGLGSMVREIRLANLNASLPYMDDKTLHGGIVLSAQNLSSAEGLTVSSNLLTRGNIGPSNLNLPAGRGSDQLVIQYRVTVPNQFDCEGTSLTVGNYVVQRFFLRAENNTRNEPNQALALACKAFSYTQAQADAGLSSSDISSGLSGNGQVIIPRVDHFSARLGVAQANLGSGCSGTGNNECLGNIAISDYLALTATSKPHIVSVQIGLLTRSLNTIGSNPFFNANQNYDVLLISAPLIAADKNALYLRSVVTQVIALRNGFGIQ